MDDLNERGIRPVCDALNAVPGVRTLWSCEGHPIRESRPYVVFVAPKFFAWRVHRALVLASADGSLKYPWWLNAHFRDNGRLQWCIEPNCRIPRWKFVPVIRLLVDAELQRLAVLIRNQNRTHSLDTSRQRNDDRSPNKTDASRPSWRSPAMPIGSTTDRRAADEPTPKRATDVYS
jgi:hypothetical protein